MSVCDKSNTVVLAGSALAQGLADRAYDLLSKGDSLHLQKAAEILISSGQCEALRFLIYEYKLDVDKHYLLHLALLAEQEDIAKLLIVSGADVNICWQGDKVEANVVPFFDMRRPLLRRWEYGETALHMAVTIGNVEIIKLLIDHGSDVEAKTCMNDTALTYACDNSSAGADCVQVLLENGANPNSMTGDRLTKGEGETSCTRLMPIHCATEWGDIQKLQLLLQHGAHLEARTSDGHTALTLAYEASVPADCVRILLENGAFPNVKISNQQTPFTLAREQDDEEKISLLKQYGASEEERTDLDTTSLISACQRSGDFKSVRSLLGHNASPNLKNGRGETSLHYAALAGDIQNLQALVEHNADVNSMDDNGMTPLMKACSEVFVSKNCVQFLLENQALPNLTSINGETALHHAAKSAVVQKVKMLIQYGANVNATDINNITPLMEVCVTKDSTECVRFLLQKKASPKVSDMFGNTALHRAACSGSKEAIKLLLQYRADVNAMTNCCKTPLMLAFINDQADCVLCLLQNNALPNLTDNNGYTALHLAAERGDRKMMNLLVLYQANVNAVAESGETPLLLGCKRGESDCVRFLLHHNALPNLTDKSGNTALHLAVAKKDKEVVNLQLHADVNAITKTVETPLMLACKYGHIECARILLQNNALPNLTDNNGYTALHLATERKDKTMADLLIQYQKDVNATSQNGETPLMLSCAKGFGKERFVHFLLKKRALANLSTKEHKTALHYAASKGTSGEIQMLFEHGTEIDSSFLFSIATRSEGYIKLIKRLGADINVVDSTGQNAVMLAASSNDVSSNISALQRLVNIGVSVNQKDNKGWTPLMAAVHRRSFKMAKFLLEAGADVHAVRRTGKTESTILDYLLGSKYNSDCVGQLIQNGIVNSLPTKYNAFLHKMIMADERKIIAELVSHGMGPTLCRVPDVFYFRRRHVRHRNVRRSAPVSPLTVALKYGTVQVIRYLIANLVLCPCDLNVRFYHSELRPQLYQKDIKDIMDEFYAQPKSLFHLSFVTVSHAIGGVPGRVDRVNSLSLPQLFKDALLFKTE